MKTGILIEPGGTKRRIRNYENNNSIHSDSKLERKSRNLLNASLFIVVVMVPRVAVLMKSLHRYMNYTKTRFSIFLRIMLISKP